MNVIDIRNSRKMNNDTTLKSVLNRQFVALNTYLPISTGAFECNRLEGLGSRDLSISFEPFERTYPLCGDVSRIAADN